MPTNTSRECNKLEVGIRNLGIGVQRFKFRNLGFD
jgi:hypothetical protein